jgi:hypothetical protein
MALVFTMDAVAGHPGRRRVGRRAFPGWSADANAGARRCSPGFLHKLAIAVSHVLATSGPTTTPAAIPSAPCTTSSTSQRYRRDRPIRPNPRLTQYNTAHPRAAPIFPSGVLRGWGGRRRCTFRPTSGRHPKTAARSPRPPNSGNRLFDAGHQRFTPVRAVPTNGGRRCSENHITALEFTEQSLRESTNLSVFSPLCRSRSPWRPPRPPA